MSAGRAEGKTGRDRLGDGIRPKTRLIAQEICKRGAGDRWGQGMPVYRWTIGRAPRHRVERPRVD